jgi:hypothetical protein
VQGQQHHRLSWSAALPVSPSLICLTDHQRVLTSTAASPYMMSKHLWIHIGFSPAAPKYSNTAHCFKCPSISVILESTVVLPPIKWNRCGYQKIMMNVQGLQLCSCYSHKKYTKIWSISSHCPSHVKVQ